MGEGSWPPFLPPERLLRLPGEERREAGKKHFQAVMELLLEPISLLRNGKATMLGNKVAEALGRINQAVWAARHRPELLPRLGAAPVEERIQSLLWRYRLLHHPRSGAPLGPGDFLALYMGSLRLPAAEEVRLSPEQAEKLAAQLGPWLDAALLEQGLSTRMAAERLRELLPADGELVQRLLAVVVGLEPCDPAWLAVVWAQLQPALEELVGRELGPEGPG
jgi:hypothetical protein